MVALTGAVARIGCDAPHGFPAGFSLKVTGTEGKTSSPSASSASPPRTGMPGMTAPAGQYPSAYALSGSADAGYRYVAELSGRHSTARSV